MSYVIITYSKCALPNVEYEMKLFHIFNSYVLHKMFKVVHIQRGDYHIYTCYHNYARYLHLLCHTLTNVQFSNTKLAAKV